MIRWTDVYGEFKVMLLSLYLLINLIYCSTGTIVLELSKDKHNASLLDRQLVQFQSSVNRVENELSGQIRYLTQVKLRSNISITAEMLCFIVQMCQKLIHLILFIILDSYAQMYTCTFM